MNAQLQESTEVAVIQPKPLTVIERALSVFVGVPSEESLRELAKASATITEITNQAGWDQCHAARMVLKNTRLEISRTGEAGREDAVQTSRSIIAIQKSRIAITQGEEDRLAAIEQAWDDRIAAEKEARIQAEIARVARLQERVTELRGRQTLSPSSGSVLISQHIADLEAISVDASFEEFEQQAHDAKIAALVRLRDILMAAMAHQAEQAKIIAERAELAKLRAAEEARQATAEAERIERERLAKVESDRIAMEAYDKRVAAAREHAEQIRKDRERNEAALQEIQAIHHQLIIADTGRAPYCKGRDLESIDFAIDGTEKWELTEERFGPLFDSAVKTKETTLEALRQKRVDFIARQEVAKRLADERVENDRKAGQRQAELDAQAEAQRAETQRLADQQAEIDRQNEALRKANEPKPAAQELPTPAPPSAQPENWPITDAQLVALVMSHCGVGRIKADRRIRDYGKK
jgi:hypothetical protein